MEPGMSGCIWNLALLFKNKYKITNTKKITEVTILSEKSIATIY